MNSVIQVQNLSKQYILRHQTGGRASYGSLREEMTRRFSSFFQRQQGPDARREEFWALQDVSFEIKQGEAVGIIGRNGAGKSTLLKILSRITRPTKGRIEIEGHVASLLEVGTGFHQELTGRENIFLNGAILGMPRAEIKKRFDEIVAFAEVEKFLDTPVKRYSSGMYMRLAFAVAAHLDPEILIVDEVLAVGDAQFQKKCLGKMEQVSSGGRTVLFVSHQINAVEQLCSRVLLMEKGQLKLDSREVRKVTRKYLFGEDDAGTSAPSEWSATGSSSKNPWFSPLRFYLGNQEGQPLSMPVANHSEIEIYLEADVQILDPALTIGYAIYAESGELLYWSYQSDDAAAPCPPLKPGRVILRGSIPCRLLNEGRYRIELIGGLHHRQWLFEPGASPAQIFLTIQGGLSDSPLWTQKRPGLLAPVLPWKLLP